MKYVTGEMLKIYVPYSNLDWMNYKLVKDDLTYHHIQKKSDNGVIETYNGALLMPIAHTYLHLIEEKDEDLYFELNKIFMTINKQQMEPNHNQRMKIEKLLNEFESKYINKVNKKGKVFIKKEYLKRW